jgi:tetratricopeptide (TPR) repeat protein
VEEAVEIAKSIEPGFKDPGLHNQLLQRELFRLAKKNAAAHPLRYAWFSLQRLATFWEKFLPVLFLGLIVAVGAPARRSFQVCFLVLLSFSGYAVAGGAPDHLVAVDPLVALITGCGIAFLLSKFLASRCPSLFQAPAQHIPTALLAAPIGLAALYAVMVGLLAWEVARYWRPGVPSPVDSRSWCDGRDLDMLKLGTVQSARKHGPGSRESMYYHYVVPHFYNLFLRGEYETVERDLTRALLQDPEIPELLDVLGRNFAAQGRVKEGLAFAERLLRFPRLKRESLAEIHVFRMKLLAEAGTLMGTAASLQLATAALPIRDKTVWGSAAFKAFLTRFKIHRASRLIRLSRFEEAADVLTDSAIETEGNRETQAKLLALRAVVLGRLGHREAAWKEMKRALARDAGLACRSAMEGFERREIFSGYFDQCLARFPGDSTLLTERGIARAFQGDAQRASSDFQEALRARPEQLEAAFNLATLLRGQGNVHEALKILDRALAKGSHRQAEPVYAYTVLMRDILRGDAVGTR